MGDFMEGRVKHFLDRITNEALVGRGGGQVQVDSLAVRAIVRSEPELAELVVKAYAAMGQQNPKLFQMAIIVASAYQVEFKDDRLVRYVQQESRGQSIDIGIKTPGGQVTTHRVDTSQEDAAIRAMGIPGDDLESGNIANVARIFHQLEADSHRPRLLQGKIAFDFSTYAKDARPDFAIPAIRQFIRMVDAEFPYFLYYLIAHPEAGQVRIYYMSLLRQEDIEVIPGHWFYHGTAVDMINMLRPRLAAIRAFCRKTGDDADPIITALLESFPHDVRTLAQLM